ncbi:MAG: tRNA dihydrouridine synthase DusB, partial [Cryobacterium sp.]|nr:tRNA dihydrouridine synthase DusB [Cryobacterium sp.]
VESFQQMDDLLGELDWDAPYPGEDAEGPRGRAGHPKRTALPEGWLDSRNLGEVHRADLTEGEADTTGG